MVECEVAMRQGLADKPAGRHMGAELMPCPDEKRRVKIEAGRPSLGKCETVFGGSAEQGQMVARGSR